MSTVTPNDMYSSGLMAAFAYSRGLNKLAQNPSPENLARPLEESFTDKSTGTVYTGQTFNLFRIGEDGKRHRVKIEGEPLAPKVDLAPAGAKVDPATPPALTPKVN